MKVLDELILQELKQNIAENLSLYEESCLFSLVNIKKEAYENHSLKMYYQSGNESSCDVKNAEYIYELYKNIPVELATEEGFWAYLAHTEFAEYLQKRWPMKESDNTKDFSTIENHYFFGKEKPYYRHGLSRLWWAAHLTYAPNSVDPYRYTKIAMKDQERTALLIETVNLSRNKTALFATLDILNELDIKKEKKYINKIKNERQTVLRQLVKFVNSIGGVTVWDLLSQEEAKNKIQDFIIQLEEDGIIVYVKEEVN